MSTSTSTSPISPWPRRFALAAAASAVPLVAFGGSVTTMGAGMAVEGWWNAEGHFLPLFPIEKWLRDPATFVEHTHRLFGMLVGFFAIGYVVAAFATRASKGQRLLAIGALLAVCVQGTLGGFRVLEDSKHFAFLHGVLAQGVFALLVASAVAAGPAWRSATRRARGSGSLGLLAAVVFLLAYAQVGLGAWYRHGLRHATALDPTGRFQLHLYGAIVVFAAVMLLATKLERDGHPRLGRAGRGLRHLLFAQVALGFATWLLFDPNRVPLSELATSILHVVLGAALLAATGVAVLWVVRVGAHESRETTSVAAPVGGGGAA